MHSVPSSDNDSGVEGSGAERLQPVDEDDIL